MSSPKKAVELSKAVLNITTYKPHPGSDFPDVRQCISVDITDLLEKNGVESIYQVSGVSSLEKDNVISGPEDYGLHVQIAVSEPEIRLLEKKMYDILDAAIVNEKQSKAIKKLIAQKFDDFNLDHFDPIKQCDFTKEHIDKLFEKELSR